MKEQIIQLPDNFEVKEIKDGKIILFEKEKNLTYESIRDKELPKQFYIRNDIQCTSSRQYQKLLAINKLMNLAKWFNDGWQPDWDYRHEKKYYIYIGNEQIKICYTDTVQYNNIYFKSMNLAQQAIEILGKETIKLALCTDY